MYSQDNCIRISGKRSFAISRILIKHQSVNLKLREEYIGVHVWLFLLFDYTLLPFRYPFILFAFT